MNSILIIPDVHLGKSSSIGKIGVGQTLNSRIIDQINLLEWCLEQAISRSVNKIIITGDVFEEPKPHYNLVVLLIDWLKKCTNFGIDVHIVAGNHDILRSGQFTTSPLDVITASDIEGIYIYKKISTLHLEDMAITFMPFRDRRSFNTDKNSEALAKLRIPLPYQLAFANKDIPKILVGHLAIEGSIPVGNELDDLANELFCPLEMFKGYDYVWMGHVHKFQIVSDNPHISHLGSMDISDFGESDQQKYIVIFDPQKGHEYIELPTRKLLNINIELPENESNATEFISNYIEQIDGINNSIVKLTIKLPSSAQYSIDRSLIEDKIYKAGAFFTSKISEERTFVSLKKQINKTIDNAIDEMSAIKTYSSLIEENMREEFINTASNIISEFKQNNKN